MRATVRGVRQGGGENSNTNFDFECFEIKFYKALEGQAKNGSKARRGTELPEGQCRYSPDSAGNPGRCFCLPSHGIQASRITTIAARRKQRPANATSPASFRCHASIRRVGRTQPDHAKDVVRLRVNTLQRDLSRPAALRRDAPPLAWEHPFVGRIGS